MEDSEIIMLFLQRDEIAIEQTKKKYGKKIKKLAYDLTEDLLSAEECESDTYLAAWESIPPNKPCDYLYPFLARITRHLALNVCRDRARIKRKAQLEELNSELQQVIPGDLGVDEHIMEAELQRVINRFLADQSPDKRKIFVRRYWYLDSVKTIADGFGFSENKVKVTLYRLREELKKELEKEGYKK